MTKDLLLSRSGKVMVVGVGVGQMVGMLFLMMKIGLHDSSIRIVLGSGGVGVADGRPNLGNVVAIACKNKCHYSHKIPKIF